MSCLWSAPPGFNFWDSFCSTFQLYALLYALFYLLFMFYILGDDTSIKKGSFMLTKHLCVMIFITIKGDIGAVKYPSSEFLIFF